MLTAFALVYVIWGSTYLAIRVSIETIPPLLMAGGRFLIAGLLLYVWQRCRGADGPQLRDWRTAAIVGSCLLFAGNGALTYSEQFISSGLAAVLIAVVPLFFALLSWGSGASERPRLVVWIGIAVATAGVAIIVRPGLVAATTHNEAFGVTIVLVGALIWSVGSLYAGRVQQKTPPFLMAAMQMICASVLLLAASLFTGEWSRVRPGAITAASAGALVYLIFAGSILAFTAYLWLLRNVESTRVGTYAYVNPVVAVLLGHFVAREELTPTLLVGSAFVITGVALIVTFRTTIKPTTQPVISATGPKLFGVTLAPADGCTSHSA